MMTDTSTGGRTLLSSGSDTYARAVDFLYGEAALLDDRRHREWLDLLTPDIVYRAPVRVTSAHTLADSALADMAHFDEDLYSLTKRVERFETDYAWAEDPPSRTRRNIMNIRCWEGDRAGEVVVQCNLLLFRSRGDVYRPDLLSGRRSEVLRDDGQGFKLARREVLLDESVLLTQNLAVFL